METKMHPTGAIFGVPAREKRGSTGGREVEIKSRVYIMHKKRGNFSAPSQLVYK
jgi:hypothetical protein